MSKLLMWMVFSDGKVHDPGLDKLTWKITRGNGTGSAFAMFENAYGHGLHSWHDGEGYGDGREGYAGNGWGDGNNADGEGGGVSGV